MGDFTDQDRMMQQRTLTLLEAHVKTSDERHTELKKKLDDHEKRIRVGERFRAWFIGLFTTSAAGGGALAGLKQFIDGSGG